MIKNIIYVLLLTISIVCVYGINCIYGNVENGVCKCGAGYTGADCSLRTCQLGESFSITTSKDKSLITRELQSEGDKSADSKMELILPKKRMLSVEGIQVKSIVESDKLTVGGCTFDKLTFGADLGLDKNGGVIKCDKQDSTLTKIVYGKTEENDKNVYYVENGLDADYNCFVISKRNDLSLLLMNVEISTNFELKDEKYSSKVTIAGLGTLFTNMGIVISSGNIAFKTSTAGDNTIYTGIFTSKLVPTEQPPAARLLNDNSSRILAGENFELTITTSSDLGNAAVEITPYLLMKADGSKVSIENSELGKYVNNIDGKYKLTKVGTVIDISGKNIYAVSDIVYEGIGINGGKLSCIDIYGNKFNGNIYSYKESTKTYYIEYDKGITEDKIPLSSCDVISFENDLSLLLKDFESSAISCTGDTPSYTCGDITITGLGTLFKDMGIESPTPSGNVAFKTSDNSIYKGTFTYTLVDARRLLNENSSRILAGENVKLTIISNEKIEGPDTITPYLLINAKGDKLSIENSEIGYYINNIDDKNKLTKAETTIQIGQAGKEIKIYPVSDVIYEGIEKNGGKLSCSDIYGNKFNGNIYSYKETDKTYFIEYDKDITQNEILYSSCDVMSVENDLSLLLKDYVSTDTITCEETPTKYTCEDITINGLGKLFKDMGIKDPITDGNIAFTKSTEGDNKIYKGKFTSSFVTLPRLLNDNSSRILNTGNDVQLTITTETKIDNGVSITPYLLIKADETEVLIQNSELYENVQCNNKNECVLIKSENNENIENSITMKNGKLVFNLNNINANKESLELKVYEEAKSLFLQYFREGLSLIDEDDKSVVITEVKNITTSSRRLLLENERKLEVEGEEYSIKTYPVITTLSTGSIRSSFVDYHPNTIECSGQGNCNRKTGECECYEGYSGSNCGKMSCANNCNGNGECKLIKNILKNDKYSNFGYSESIYGCECSEKYRGYDCSLSECDSNKDPRGGSNKENLEYRDCSGRGICDYTVGTCNCFTGYGGSDCSKTYK